MKAYMGEVHYHLPNPHPHLRLEGVRDQLPCHHRDSRDRDPSRCHMLTFLEEGLQDPGMGEFGIGR